MESINKTLLSKEVTEALTNSNSKTASVNCWRCLGVGVRIVDGYARNCLCLRRKTQRALLALIPPQFGMPRLSRLKACSDLHRNQAAAIKLVQDFPNDSYLFIGKNGTGKSHISWAIYRNAIAQRRPAIACTVRDLLAEYRRVEIGVTPGEMLRSPRITAEKLRKPGKKYLLFLDEFEKARPSEFAAEQLFNLLDAAKSFNHQIVVTSNMSAEALRVHWSRADEVYGNSIMTRLWDCRPVEFF